MNWNRVVNCLYISLDGQILNKYDRKATFRLNGLANQGYLQNKMAIDSRELINKKSDFCQVNLQTNFQCTTVKPIYLKKAFKYV